MKVRIIGGLSKKRNFPGVLTANDEVWCMNAIRPDWLPRVDRNFNLHTRENLERYKWPHIKREAEWSRDNPRVPFYTIDRWPDPYSLDGWREFPGRRMMKEMDRGNYHCTSLDWLVGFALFRTMCANCDLDNYDEDPNPADAHLFDWYHIVRAKKIYGYDDTPVVEDLTLPPGQVSYDYDR